MIKLVAIWIMIVVIILFAGIIYDEVQAAPYARSEFGNWNDADKDCQDTRQEVLIAESFIPVTFEDDSNCRVATGLWICPYTGMVFNTPYELDVDHVVPLKEVWDSGGEFWTREKRKAYFNYLDDPYHLVAVWKSSNRSKGSRDPAKWMPPNRAFWTEYLSLWLNVKFQWQLSIDPVEDQAIRYLDMQGVIYEKGDLMPYLPE